MGQENGHTHGRKDEAAIPTVEEDYTLQRRKRSESSLSNWSFILRCVLEQRMGLYLLQFVGSRWDFSTDAFKGVDQSAEDWNLLDRALRSSVAGLTRWDSLHFLYIMEHNYVLETSLAFFPLFPLMVRVASHCWASPFVYLGVIGLSTAYVITGLTLNLLFFLCSALLLYRIALQITKSSKTATISVLLFSLNPASVFFSSFYTESLFLLLSLSGVSVLLSSWLLDLRIFFSSIIFLFSFLTRSNGFLNVGYVLFYAGMELMNDDEGTLWWTDTRMGRVKKVFSFIVRGIVALSLVSLASLIMSTTQHSRFCLQKYSTPPSAAVVAYAREHNISVLGDEISWCSVGASVPLPAFYYSIQRKYWDVTPFGYWQLIKVPCFVMAAPAFFLLIFCSLRLCKRLYSQHVHNPWSFFKTNADLVPFCVHSVVLALSALTVYNVEVFTRIVFSSTPFLYIEVARWISDNTPKALTSDLRFPRWLPLFGYLYRKGGWFLLLVLYILVYFIGGTVMHAAFLPFT